MKKSKHVIKIALILIAILLVAITGFVFANGSESSISNEYEDNQSPTGDRTYVRLERTANNKMNVYLEFADTTVIEENEEQVVKPGASVASFQIGLDIDMELSDENAAINFTFDPALKDETYCKLMRTSKGEHVDETTGRVMGEQLNIYYVGTKELNDSVQKEGIKVGTISFDGIEHEETVSIRPDATFTKVASIGHKETEVNIEERDNLVAMILQPTVQNPEEDIPGGDDEQQGDDDDQGGDNEGDDNQGDDQEQGGDSTGEDGKENSGTGNENGNTTNNPKTGDIAVGVIATIMIVSVIGMIVVKTRKKHK